MQRTPPPRYRPPLKRPQTGETPDSSFIGRCPHLGTAADSGTALAFASDANQCYRTRLPVPVSMVHQQSYCLSSDYAQCPVYQQNMHFAEAAPLVTAPPSWQMDEGEVVTDVVIGPSRRQSDRSPVLPVMILLALLAGGLWLWRGYLAQPDSAAEPSMRDLAIGEVTPFQQTLPQSSGEGQPGEAIAVIVPTHTPQPSSTPAAPEATDSAPRNGIKLPVLPTASAVAPGDDVALAADCTSPEWWVPYTVVADDTLPNLARIRGLTEDDVLVGNCLATTELTVGQIVLLPPLAVVIGIAPTGTAIAPAATSTRAISTRVAQATPVPNTATPVPTVPASPTPFPTSFPDDPPGGFPTSQPPAPTAFPTTPPRATQTATVPAVGPSATPDVPRPTVTPPSVIPTSTPPPTATFERPTQTPPPIVP